MKRRKLFKSRIHWLGLRNTSAQATIEYTVLIAAIAAVTSIGTAVFFQKVCRAPKPEDANNQYSGTPILKSYFNRVVERIR